MSIFDKIKSTLGLQKQKQKPVGHRLGGDVVAGGDQDIISVFPYEYDVEFKEEGSLGLIVNDCEGKALVTDVVESGQASKLGVEKHDFIVAIDGNNITSYDAFMAIVPALGRPVRLKLYRDPAKKSMIAGGNSSKSAPLSEKEKDERREAMIKAANDRQSSWDKRLERSAKNRGISQKGNIMNDNNNVEPINPETLKTIEAAKRKEQALKNSLGYDPFKPLLSSNISGSNSSTATPELSSSSPRYASSSPRANSSESPRANTTSPIPSIDYESIGNKYPSLVDDLDGSFSLMLTSADTGAGDSSDNVNVCLTTISKILSNLINSPNDVKYRCIRVNNPALQSKVFVIPGAINILLAAGFSVSIETTDVSSEEYLKHTGTEEAIQFCQYTLYRIQEILS